MSAFSLPYGSNDVSLRRRNDAPHLRFSRKGFYLLVVLLSASITPHLLATDVTETSDLRTGIEGSLSMSPAQGGPSRQGMPDSAPLRHVTLMTQDSVGATSTFETDDNGRFHVGLKPGHYTVGLKGRKMKPGNCGPFTIDVPADGFLKVSWSCDSGLR